jgi:hypothetical protein
MLRNGPIPAAVHALGEYAIGLLFVALPLLLHYDSGAATAASIVIGVGLIGFAATTDWSLSLANNIPKPAHLVVDFLVVALLIASPFLFGFSNETAPTAIFIAAGLLHLLVTIGTRFVRPEATAEEPGAPAPTEPGGSVEPKPSRRFERPSDNAEPPTLDDRQAARRDS